MTGRYHCDACGWDSDTPAQHQEPIVTTDSTWLWTMLVCPVCGEEVYETVILQHPPEAHHPQDPTPTRHQRGATMATSNTPTKAQIDEVVALMEDTGIDLYLHVLPEVFINWEDQDVLALLPAEIVHASLVYLRQEKTAQDDE
jgi:hypothetical protein